MTKNTLLGVVLRKAMCEVDMCNSYDIGRLSGAIYPRGLYRYTLPKTKNQIPVLNIDTHKYVYN